MVDFFVSYTKTDTDWAKWIAWELEESGGYQTYFQAWDMRPGQDFVSHMDHATEAASRTIAVVSVAYSKSKFASKEWKTALAKDADGTEGKLIPVRIDENWEPRGMFGTIVYIDLVGLPLEEAKAALLDGVRSGRAKDESAPDFPGLSDPTGHRELTDQGGPTIPNIGPVDPLRQWGMLDIKTEDTGRVSVSTREQGRRTTRLREAELDEEGLKDTELQFSDMTPANDNIELADRFEAAVSPLFDHHQNEPKSKLIVKADLRFGSLPWEWLAGQKLGLTTSSPGNLELVRDFGYKDCSISSVKLAPAKALIVGDPSSDLPELPTAAHEAQCVSEMCIRYGIETTARIQPSATEFMQSALLEHHYIWHITSHGTFAQNNLAGAVIGPELTLSPREIHNIRMCPKLVFLNFSHAALLEDSELDGSLLRDRHRLCYQMAQSFVANGTEAVVATGWAYNQDASLTFMDTFYREFISNKESFGRSTANARKAAYPASLGELTWGAFFCFGNPQLSIADLDTPDQEITKPSLGDTEKAVN